MVAEFMLLTTLRRLNEARRLRPDSRGAVMRSSNTDADSSFWSCRTSTPAKAAARMDDRSVRTRVPSRARSACNSSINDICRLTAATSVRCTSIGGTTSRKDFNFGCEIFRIESLVPVATRSM